MYKQIITINNNLRFVVKMTATGTTKVVMNMAML